MSQVFVAAQEKSVTCHKSRKILSGDTPEPGTELSSPQNRMPRKVESIGASTTDREALEMTKRTQKRPPKKRKGARRSQKPRILESLSGTDALAIIEILIERHDNLAQEIDVVAEELLREIDIEGLAADVKDALEFLEVEDVWDRSGATKDGYVEPGEAAWEMFDETLQPFRRDVEKYRKLAMLKEANLCYQGILKGIHDFDNESSTEYKEWAADAPAEYFGLVLDEWKALPEGRFPLSEMRDFIDDQCPAYAELGARRLRSRKRGSD